MPPNLHDAAFTMRQTFRPPYLWMDVPGACLHSFMPSGLYAFSSPPELRSYNASTSTRLKSASRALCIHSYLCVFRSGARLQSSKPRHLDVIAPTVRFNASTPHTTRRTYTTCPQDPKPPCVLIRMLTTRF